MSAPMTPERLTAARQWVQGYATVAGAACVPVQLLAEVDRVRALIADWREHPAITLDDDGTVIVHMREIEGRDAERVKQYRERTWAAERERDWLRAQVAEAKRWRCYCKRCGYSPQNTGNGWDLTHDCPGDEVQP